MSTVTEQPLYFAGLDLGCRQDFSALVVVERRDRPDPKKPGEFLRAYALRHLQRWPKGTPYSKVVADVVTLVSRPPLPYCWLAVDVTGVGDAVFQTLAEARPMANLCAIHITGGTNVVETDRGYSVPKPDLAGVVSVLLENRLLDVSPKLAGAGVLRKELETFTTKVTPTGHETMEAWRSRDHDDEVLATAICLWLAERTKVLRSLLL